MKPAMTPIRSQYLRVKQKYPHAIVLFRLGDFYETFDEDAKIAARELEIALTSREMGKGNRVPMAGIPYHALENYLARLINRGYKVAICEQMSDPAASQGLVEREVVRVVTPGTVVEPGLLTQKANNYLVAVAPGAEAVGIAYVDITTSEFATTQLPTRNAGAEIERLRPSEVLVAKGAEGSVSWLDAPVTHLDDQWFELGAARETLLHHFEAASLEGYGCAHLPLATAAAGAIIHYLEETQKGALTQLNGLSTYSAEAYMVLDAQTRRNLELFQSNRLGTATHSLLSVIDLTKTPMGGRLLKRWLGQPLLDLAELNKRQDMVAWFHESLLRRTQVAALLGGIGDLERLVNRIRASIASPKELVALRHSLEKVPQLQEALNSGGAPFPLPASRSSLQDVVALISGAITDDPPTSVAEGGVIRTGFSKELDGIRSASKDAKQYLAGLEREERSRTGIKSLKVGYNKVFGYYIEVSKPNLSQVPVDYIRKQTLLGAERFFTPQLKEYESTILNAQERIVELEAAIFRQVCSQVGAAAEDILTAASALARVDVFLSLAEVAARHGYVQPKLTGEEGIAISGGRHPVVEQAISDEAFVPNDTHLSCADDQLIILTGPNMSGKSTYLRQVALIVLLAQTGSFIPADAATIGLVDRIFTRVGAQDDLATGRSTFMVEMVETANILNNATSRSLIILDEIGRGTSTYDGLSIAWAVVEYLHNHPRLGTKTLFATHYHELVQVAEVLPRVRNFNVAVAEEGGKVVFLRRVVPGGADKSYGIHVAQLAGLPRAVLHRADEVLQDLEAKHLPRQIGGRRRGQAPAEQLPLFGAPRSQSGPVLEEIASLDVSSMTPLEAITKLYELQRKLNGSAQL
ncbi:MAG: DNA mismatch repair protein MutS [Chloroflexi bacterium]|nr:DNA mismatch repair protein MutS [Chloroflexota bacterium]